MDQPKIERMLRLMKMLAGNVEYTVDDIACRLDMSRRTVYRYIDTFRDAGFLIKKSGNRIRLDKESPHFKEISSLVHFTEEEAIVLRNAIESIGEENMLKTELKRKLYSVYSDKNLADIVVKGRNARNVNALIEAIETHRQVCLHDYRSSTSERDRLVEPFSFTTNYLNVWCYDLEDGKNKIFKTSRIGLCEVLAEQWKYENSHREGFMDIFRMIGENRTKIKLRLGSLAHSLLIEEYPLAEKYVSADGDNHWILECEVASMRGVGRFVIGLLDDIEIIESHELQLYINEYAEKYLK